METSKRAPPFPIPRRNVRSFNAAGLLALPHSSDIPSHALHSGLFVFSQHLQLRGQRWIHTKLPF